MIQKIPPARRSAHEDEILARETFELYIVTGIEGSSVALNDHRIAGPKPWGGGRIERTWSGEKRDILAALALEEAEEGDSRPRWRTIDGNEPTGDYVDPATARVFRKSESGNWYLIRYGTASSVNPAGRIYGPIPIDRMED